MDIHRPAHRLVGVDHEEAEMVHTSQEEVFRTFDSSLLPFLDPFDMKQAGDLVVVVVVVVVVAAAAVVMPENELAS